MLEPIYGFDEVADMASVVPPDGTMFVANGLTTRGDRPPLVYWYSASSTTTPNGNSVVCPSSITPPAAGRYLQVPFDYNALLNLPALKTVATSGSYTDLLNLPAAPSFTTPARSISTTGSNNTFTISTTRNALATYVINFSAALTLTTSNGRVSLDYSTNGGSTWNLGPSVSQVFGVSVTITTNSDCVLSRMIPANALVRINQTNNTNVTVTLSANQQEVLF